MAKPEVTQLLQDATKGSSTAVEQLLPLVYDELRKLAGAYLSKERREHTLQATALVHEAYLRLVSIEEMDWKNRAHFFAVAANSIRRILVDHARRRKAKKRGGTEEDLPLEIVGDIQIDPTGTDILALHEALERFAFESPDKARVVELRFFAGLTAEETAEVMGVTTRTIERHWRFGRAWLFDALQR